MPTERTYTISEAAALTGMHRNTIRLRIKMGQLDATVQPGKFGDEYRISHSALQRAGILAQDGPLGEMASDAVLLPEEERDGNAVAVETAAEEQPREPEANGAVAGPALAALGELYQRHEQAMFRLGYLQGELERLKALAETAESLREDRETQGAELTALRRELEEKARLAEETEALRREREALQQELENARRRLQEMDALRQDIEQLKTMAENAQASRKRSWWQFWRS